MSESFDLSGRTALVTGSSRGIGAAIARRFARDGANVVIVAKSDRPHRVLPGTIHTVADEVEAAGGRALPIAVDLQDLGRIEDMVDEVRSRFGKIDVLVNNASAILLAGTEETPMRRFDLMFSVNVRATFAVTQACLPLLRESDNPHVLNLSPPPDLDPRWFAPHVAYTMSKFGMSFCVLGMAEEFRDEGIAFNGLWPRTVIATAALNMLGSGVEPKLCRKPEIVADAAREIVTRSARTTTARFFIDEEVLREAGVESFDEYAVEPGNPLLPDLFTPEFLESGFGDRTAPRRRAGDTGSNG